MQILTRLCNEDIDQIIDKTALIEWIVNDNLPYEWSTKHKQLCIPI